MVNHGPYSFAMSKSAVLVSREHEHESGWINIDYPSLNMTVHCSYKAVQGFRDAQHQGNLPQLTADALDFVYKHSVKANSIPEQAFMNPGKHVYGVYFELEGNTASPCQFFLTDSTHHFFRGAVYNNCRPNADSLAPVHAFIRNDMRVLMESFEWRDKE